MARFHNLTVTDIHHTIRDAVVLTLEPEEAGTFDFTQGQYLTFRRAFDGEELRRGIRSARRRWRTQSAAGGRAGYRAAGRHAAAGGAATAGGHAG